MKLHTSVLTLALLTIFLLKYSPSFAEVDGVVGDLTGDGVVNLSDVITGLKVLGGNRPGIESPLLWLPENDVNGNGKVDLSEIHFALRSSAANSGLFSETKLLPWGNDVALQGTSSVAISGNTIVVGACNNEEFGLDTGIVYIYHFDGTVWQKQARLRAADTAAGDRFGASVAISGNTLVVGAEQDKDKGFNAGSVYVFTFNGTSWNQEANLTASDGADSSYFGNSVTVTGDTLAVGARFHAGTGAVYVFNRQGTSWTQTTKLTGADTSQGDMFGVSVDMDTNYIAVGATGDDQNGILSGSAYVFKKVNNIWTQQAKITPADGTSYDLFGASVSIDNDDIVIGAPFDDDKGVESGSVYVFHQNVSGWTQTSKIIASGGASGDYFGSSVSYDSGIIVVGAPFDDDRGPTTGSVYTFSKDNLGGWNQMWKFTATDSVDNSSVGGQVAVSGSQIVATASGDDDMGTLAGASYVLARKSGPSATNMNQIFTYTEDMKDFIELDDIVITDPDPGKLVTARLTLTHAFLGSLTSSSGNGETYQVIGQSWARKGLWSVTGTVATTNAALAAVRFIPIENGDLSTEISTHVEDQSGAGPADGVVIINVNPVNDTPSVINPLNIEDGKLTASDGMANDSFGGVNGNLNGRNIAYNGTSLVVGAPYPVSSNNIDTGAVYIYNKTGTTFTQQSKLVPAQTQAFDDGRFGSSVAASDNKIIVGAPRTPTNGAVYSYSLTNGTWGQPQIINAPVTPGTNGSWFGHAVAINGNYMVVSAPHLPSSGGGVYIYNWTGASWALQQMVPGKSAFQRFGMSLALEGDYLIIGAPADDEVGENSGAAYVYHRSGSIWTEQTKITNTSQGVAYLGTSVAISGERIAIGVPHAAYGGQVKIYKRSVTSWLFESTVSLFEPCVSSFARFGSSLSFKGDTLAIGAWANDEVYGSYIQDVKQYGAVYLFEEITPLTWTMIAKYGASDFSENNYLGTSVTLVDNMIFAGSPGDDDNGIDTGSVYYFKDPVISYSRWATSVPLPDIVVNDPDTGDNITVTLTLQGMQNVGSLSYTSFNGEWYSPTTGVWTITEKVEKVNLALKVVSLIPDSSNVFDSTITVHVEDSAGDGPCDSLIRLEALEILP